MTKTIKLTLSVACLVLVLIMANDAKAHPGRTDANGGHTCRTNCASYGLEDGEYHYHNGGGTTTTTTPKPTQSTSKPASTPKPVATPETTKTVSLLNRLFKDKGVNKDIILADLILRELKGTTTSKASRTVNTKVLEPAVEPITKQVENKTETYYKVTSVVDGDTIRVLIDGKTQTVRLLAIDTPETKDPRKAVQCFGESASQKMAELVKDKFVKLENDTTQPDKDKYQRLLRYVYLEDGTNVNAEMVKQGFAFAYTRFPTAQLDQMRAYEKEARENNRGLWGSCTINENGSSKSTNSI